MKDSLVISTELAGLIADAGEVAGYLWQKGWAERNAGNISVDITALLAPASAEGGDAALQRMEATYAELAGRAFLVTGTGKRMRDLPAAPAANAALIRMAADGNGYYIVGHDIPLSRVWERGRGEGAPLSQTRERGRGEGAPLSQVWERGRGEGRFCCRPTSELNSHLAIHQLLRQRGAPQTTVLHTHPNELIALTHLPAYAAEPALNRLLWSMHPETKIVIPEGVGLVPYQVPGSSRLEAATLQAVREHRVVLWEKHGAVAVGRDVFEAFDLIDTLNKSAQIFFLCMTAGSPPQGLTDAQVDELERAFAPNL